MAYTYTETQIWYSLGTQRAQSLGSHSFLYILGPPTATGC